MSNRTKANLTKREIIVALHAHHGSAVKQAVITEIVQDTLDIFMAALGQGRCIELRGFGVLEVQKRKARIGRNPNCPERDVQIPARTVVKFKAGKELKAKLDQLPA